MPKKTKTQVHVRPELLEILTGILRDRGLMIADWPADEAAAYHEHGGFMEGRDAVQQVHMSKAAAAIERIFGDVVRAAELSGYVEGVSAAQAMTGFSDETFRSILDKDGNTGIGLDGGTL